MKTQSFIPGIPGSFYTKFLLSCYCMASVLSFISCQKNNQPSETISAITKTDVKYGDDPKQKMDIYLPPDRSTDSTKVIVIIHGGAWTEGDKTDFNFVIPKIKQKLPGYAIFNINYRLAANGNNLFPSQENDVKAAISFIYDRRDEYRISDQFVYLGASAGAHLALLQGFKYDTPLKPKAVVSFYGPTNLTDLYNTNPWAGLALLQVTGYTPVNNSAIYLQSSPSSFVTAASPPTLLLQGDMDPVVPFSQAASFNTLLANAGVPHQYVLYPGEGHSWTGATLDDSLDKIAAFLAVYVP